VSRFADNNATVDGRNIQTLFIKYNPLPPKFNVNVNWSVLAPTHETNQTPIAANLVARTVKHWDLGSGGITTKCFARFEFCPSTVVGKWWQLFWRHWTQGCLGESVTVFWFLSLCPLLSTWQFFQPWCWYSTSSAPMSYAFRCCLLSMEPNPFVQIIERIISMLSLDGCGCGAKLEQRCQSGIQVRIPYSVYRLLCRVLPGTVVGLFHDESMQKKRAWNRAWVYLTRIAVSTESSPCTYG